MDAKLYGSNVVMFQLPNGDKLKVTVQCNHVTVARTEKNDDGSPKFNPNLSINATYLPSRPIKASRSMFPTTVQTVHTSTSKPEDSRMHT